MMVIFSRDNCQWCDRAKELLIEKEEDFIEFIIPDCSEILTFMKYNNLKTVPQVYLDGNLIGGYQELEAYFAKH
jgi:glutaredoxin